MEELQDLNVINHKFTHILHRQPYQMCKRTVMDTSDYEISFDEDGVSNHFYDYAQKAQKLLQTSIERENKFNSLIENIKDSGKGKKYDCLIGLSGGVDSSYIAYLAGENKLNPLIVHFDNGWNSELAVNNIKKIVTKYNFDLHTLVVDWEEFKDIQLSFFRASVPNIEMVTDHAIIATLFKIANVYKINYILSGSNIVTEGILPSSWGYDASDFRHIKEIHKLFGKKRIKTFPRLTLTSYFYFLLIRRMKKVNILNYLDYSKEVAIQTLEREVGWEYYGGKHFESVFTQFFQAYVLPTKFGFDKRKAHLSSLICSGQISRARALEELKMPLYSESQLTEHKEYLLKKWEISAEEFDTIMSEIPKNHMDYPNNKKLIDLALKIKRKLKF
jgi:N-acetyl sugar amidotransferase